MQKFGKDTCSSKLALNPLEEKYVSLLAAGRRYDLFYGDAGNGCTINQRCRTSEVEMPRIHAVRVVLSRVPI